MVADSEIRDGRDACARRQDGPLGHGEGAFDLALFWHGEEPDGLAVRAEDVDSGYVDTVVVAKFLDGRGEGFSQDDVDF